MTIKLLKRCDSSYFIEKLENILRTDYLKEIQKKNAYGLFVIIFQVNQKLVLCVWDMVY